MHKMEKSYKLLQEALQKSHSVYGLTRGVGLHRDKAVFLQKRSVSQLEEKSRQYNRDVLYAHSCAFGDPLSIKTVRATILIRLNTFLLGYTGIQPKVAEMFLHFLNKGITPFVPARFGSVGEADICLLPYIGLAIMGEGKVYYKNKLIPAKDALKVNKLKPITPFAKDGLGILSSNAYSAACVIILIDDIIKLLNTAQLVYAIALEGLDGNISFLLPETVNLQPYSYRKNIAEKILGHLEDSYLFQTSISKDLQDPLSYRTAAQIFGSIKCILDSLEKELVIQINSSDDNPAVITNIRRNNLPQFAQKYYLSKSGEKLYGAIIPTSNFDPLPWALKLQSLNTALVQLSQIITQQIMRLHNPKFTHLTQSLSTKETTTGFAEIQKPLMALNIENQTVGQTLSYNYFALASDIEDTATNVPMIADNTKKIIDNLYCILGIELMHAAQAVDIRKKENPNLKLGKDTKQLLKSYRNFVSFLNKDRPLGKDIEKSYQFLLKLFKK